MGSSKFIGRVGALAVALGIGVALTSGAGVSWADDGSGETNKVDSPSGDGAAPGGSPSKTKPDNPLSKIGDRIRRDIESGVDRLSDAAKRSQSEVESRISKSRERFDDVVTRTIVRTREDEPTRTRRNPSAKPSEKPEPDPVVEDAAAPTPARTAPTRVRYPEQTPTVVTNEPPKVDAVERVVQNVALPKLDVAATPTSIPAPLPAPKAATATVVSALLSAAGLAPLGAGTGPVAPAQTPALWVLMASARREFDQALNPNPTGLVSAKDAASVVAEGEGDVQPMAASVAQVTDPNQLTPKPAAPQVGPTTSVGWVTGAPTDDWFVGGTDLGIMWDNGAGKVLTIFGDTFNESSMATGWRNNVLFRTGDTNLSNGLQFDEAVVTPGGTGPGTNYDANTWWGPGAGYQNGLGSGPIGAAQVILADSALNGVVGTTYTMIPTSGISVTDPDTGQTTQYVTVMSVRTWDNPGSWTTNYSAIAYSTDGGEHWTVDPNTVRASGFLRTNKSFVPGNQNFQQNALSYGDADNPNSWTSGTVGEGERYVYVYGTPSGRQGSAYVARVPESELRNLDEYEYWSGEENGGWVKGDPSAATSVIGGGNSNLLSFLPTTGFLGQINREVANFLNGIWVGGIPTGGNVSEMSVQYNEYLDKYVVLYTDGGNNVVMRVSDSPQGEWSDPTVLVANNGAQDPKLNTAQSGMYAPMIHPWSGTDKLGDGNEQYLYYNVSYWGAYNVALKQTDLAPLKAQYA